MRRVRPTARFLSAVLFVGGTVAVSAGPAAAVGPANNAFNQAEVLGQSGSIIRSNVGATAQANEPAPVTGQAEASIWFKWTPTASQRTIVDLIGSDIDTVLSVYDTGGLPPSILNLNEIVSDDDGGCDVTSLVQFDAVAGTTYWFQMDTWDSSVTTANVHLTWGGFRGPSPANDDVSAAATVNPNPTQTVNSTNAEATSQIDYGEDPSLATVWYKIPVSTPSRVTVQVDSSTTPNSFGTVPFHTANIFTGPDEFSLTQIDSVDSGFGSTYVDVLTPDTVWVQVSGLPCEQGPFALQLSRVAGLVSTGYTQADLNGLTVAASKVGLDAQQLQHDAVGVIVFIYGLIGENGPIVVPPPTTGPILLTSSWPASDQPLLTKLQTTWSGLSAPATQKVAASIVAFLLSLT